MRRFEVVLRLGSVAVLLSVAAATGAAQNVVRVHAGSGTGVGWFGHDLALLGDVDADGVPDYVVGALFEDLGGGARGGARLFSGRSGVELASWSGEAPFSFFGNSVANAGDADGDGSDDVLVTSPQYPGGHPLSNMGRAYLYSGATRQLLRLFDGRQLSEFKFETAASAGDVDGDGHADQWISAPHTPIDGGGLTHGRVLLFSGSDGSELYHLDAPTRVYLFGTTLAALPDLDGDQVADLAVRGDFFTGFFVLTGHVYVYSGATGTLLHELVGNDSVQFGAGLTATPDVDGDGIGELAVGAPGEATVYLYSGSSGSLLRQWHGTSPATQFGFSLSAGGDVDGDGAPDLLVGAPGDADLTRARGGWHAFDLATGASIASFPGRLDEGRTGSAVAGPVDLDGDGRDDVLVGAEYGDVNGSTLGTVTLLAGDDQYLSPNQRLYLAGDPLVLDQRLGDPGFMASLWLFEIDGSLFVRRLIGGTYDGAGSFAVSGTVPPGLGGLELGFLGFGLAPDGRLHATGITRVAFD